mgnify:CR=1 FL=1
MEGKVIGATTNQADYVRLLFRVQAKVVSQHYPLARIIGQQLEITHCGELDTSWSLHIMRNPPDRSDFEHTGVYGLRGFPDRPDFQLALRRIFTGTIAKCATLKNCTCLSRRDTYVFMKYQGLCREFLKIIFTVRHQQT